MTYTRSQGADELRPFSFVSHPNPYAEGSAICVFGNTKVLCTASVEEGLPRFLANNKEQGWLTAEYAMLPRATHSRNARSSQQGGRAQEISRLIGRSLRAAVDMRALAGRTIRIDCDVLVADGSTRCASICGGYVALALALKTMGLRPLRQVAALSLGKVGGRLLADLCYAEDVEAEVDMNLVLAPEGCLIEVQATAEDGFITPAETSQMIAMGLKLAPEIFAAQNRVVEAA